MKSFTDIEQSKKLAEFLPLESADMWYDNDGESIAGRPEVRWGSFAGLASINIPCWSLAALYHILPNTEHISTTLSRGGWKIEPVDYLDNWWCEYEDENDHTRDITVTADNAIDACVEMIIRLNELKML